MATECPKCNTENPDTLKFCGECGTQLSPSEEVSPSVTKTLGTPTRSFKDQEGKWMIAKNMGDKINTPGSEYCPMISPDGKYIFFTDARRNGRKIPDKPFAYEDFMNDHNRAKNGLSHIFWVDARIIEDLKLKK